MPRTPVGGLTPTRVVCQFGGYPHKCVQGLRVRRGVGKAAANCALRADRETACAEVRVLGRHVPQRRRRRLMSDGAGGPRDEGRAGRSSPPSVSRPGDAVVQPAPRRAGERSAGFSVGRPEPAAFFQYRGPHDPGAVFGADDDDDDGDDANLHTARSTSNPPLSRLHEYHQRWQRVRNCRNNCRSRCSTRCGMLPSETRRAVSVRNLARVTKQIAWADR